ncbi:hypothetical protein [Hydrogenophaga sp. IBVHS1]|uniref:hypothetical protein n=1 Tax=unclassified Hydrogenophaga TaxID=2610897 RepID=UPI001179E094|nr:hypothetical protein [Hydrogenophaga sp. IBVHS1]
MITLLKHDTGPVTSRFQVLLDVLLKDLEDPTEEIHELFGEAVALGRKVGCIQRAFAGDTHFTYSPEHRTPVESQLLVALSVPPTEFHVALTSGGCQS